MATRGQKRHLITLQNPGVMVADGDGGYTQTYANLDPPTRYAQIKPATAADLERVSAGTVLSTATHVITMDYHDGVTTKTRITFDARTFNVTGVSSPEERKIETVAIAVEVVA